MENATEVRWVMRTSDFYQQGTTKPASPPGEGAGGSIGRDILSIPNTEHRTPKTLQPKIFRRRGFTLIEILIVVVIAALAATIALPGFVRTMQGSQLRTATRTVLMAHKYARSTSVLRQVPMAILLDSANNELEIVTMESGASSDARRGFLDERQAVASGLASAGGMPDEEKPKISSELLRKFGRDVKIEAFRSERGGQKIEDVYFINYHPNGMSDGFELVLSDGSNRRVDIVSDAISGKVEAKFGGL
jgi:prepilin-type N-terminal cleavage/methylation domain-containing protein